MLSAQPAEVEALQLFIGNHHNYLFLVVPIYKVIVTRPTSEKGACSAIMVVARGVSLEEYLRERPEQRPEIYPHLVSFVN